MIDNKPSFKGEILLCEDNELMQHILKSHLRDIGFDVTVANNGKECVEIISTRMKNGNKPFGLIFMDIYMPEMDGIEAADTLVSLGYKAPIAALTANTELNDIEVYKAHNMKYSLIKPVTPENLWSFLYKYFTPLGFSNICKNDPTKDEKRNRLLSGFVKRNQTTYSDISNAIRSGDIKLAHRLVHTLKGLAALMGKSKLTEVSQIVESSLSVGISEHIDEQMTSLEFELKSVLDELSCFLEESHEHRQVSMTVDKEKKTILFEELEQLLRSDNAGCKELTHDLRSIPGTSELIGQIEDYEFEKALEILIKMKNL